MIEQAAARYLLADHTKFESISLHTCPRSMRSESGSPDHTKFESISLHIFARICDFHQIITDDKINPNVVKAFEKYNLPLVVAPPAAENVGEQPTG